MCKFTLSTSEGQTFAHLEETQIAGRALNHESTLILNAQALSLSLSLIEHGAHILIWHTLCLRTGCPLASHTSQPHALWRCPLRQSNISMTIFRAKLLYKALPKSVTTSALKQNSSAIQGRLMVYGTMGCAFQQRMSRHLFWYFSVVHMSQKLFTLSLEIWTVPNLARGRVAYLLEPSNM